MCKYLKRLEAIGLSGTGVTGGYELYDVLQQGNLEPFKCFLLAAESPLQPPFHIDKKTLKHHVPNLKMQRTGGISLPAFWKWKEAKISELCFEDTPCLFFTNIRLSIFS